MHYLDLVTVYEDDILESRSTSSMFTFSKLPLYEVNKFKNPCAVQTIIQVPALVGLKIILHCFSVVMEGQVCSKLVLQLFQVQNKNKTTRVVGLRRQTAFVWRALPSHFVLG